MAQHTRRSNAHLHRIIGYLAQSVFLFVLAGVGGWGIMVAIPLLYANTSTELTTFVEVCGCIIAVQIFINWLSTKFVSSKYDPVQYGSKHTPETLNYNSCTVENNGMNSSYPQSEQAAGQGTGPLYQTEWTLCHVCKHSRPFRSHHCSVCNACILKRDHHCYFVGSCIGYRNLRNFVVFLFWTTIGTLFACAHMLPYYYYFITEDLDSAAIHPFVCLKKVILGQLHFKYFILTSLGWSLISYTFASVYYFRKYMKLILKGRTNHEQRYFIKTMDMRNTKQKLRAVFGFNWVFHFINPLYFMFTPLEIESEWQCVKLLEI